MDERVRKMRDYFNQLFGSRIYENAYIEVLEQEEIVLSANEEGYLYLIDQLLRLCENKFSHYHLDEAGMADKSEKGVVFCYKSAPW